jgi:hypothetical protein
MTQFVLTINLEEHKHHENPAAQHAKVRQLLGIAAQALGMNTDRSGKLALVANDFIGSWEFQDSVEA